MAKVGVITFLHNDNFGSSLQAYALQRVIRESGYDCEHLDYRPDTSEKILNMLRSGNHPKLILEGLRKRNVRNGIEGARQKSRSIPEFYRRRMNMSFECRNGRELKTQSGSDSILICGSDQIWNPVWLNPVYFLTFAKKEQRKIAYAPSLGIRDMPGKAKQRKLRRLVRDFQAISVREEEGAELIRKLTGFKPEVMPDPVCLLTPEEWRSLKTDEIIGKDRLVCYFIGENQTYPEKIAALKESTGKIPLVIPVTAQSYGYGYELLDGAGPEEFLTALDNAALICTDSFHGLALGTVMGKKVELIRRYRDDDPESKNSRVDQFMRSVSQEGLPSMRMRGMTWLRKAMEANSEKT